MTGKSKIEVDQKGEKIEMLPAAEANTGVCLVSSALSGYVILSQGLYPSACPSLDLGGGGAEDAGLPTLTFWSCPTPQDLA